jgi:hypothetical protein
MTFRAIAVTAAALIAVCPTSESVVGAQSRQIAAPPNWQLPDESPGLDGIVRSLIAAFDRVDIVALGEDHGEKLDSDVRMALVRHPDFAKKVRPLHRGGVRQHRTTGDARPLHSG